MSYGIEWKPRADQVLMRLDPWFAAAVLDGADRRVTLFFRYSQDEQCLHITDVSILPPF